MVYGWSWDSYDRRCRCLANFVLSINQHVAISLHGHSLAVGRKSFLADTPYRPARLRGRTITGSSLFRRDLYYPEYFSRKCHVTVCYGAVHGSSSRLVGFA